jgi:hypothetical protein
LTSEAVEAGALVAKKTRQTGSCVGEKKMRGRPPKFTEVAWPLIAQLVAGKSVTAAAAEVGVSRRSVQAWRKRAYSARPEDQPYVAFEQALQRGKLAAAETGQRVAEPGALFNPAGLPTLDELLADFAVDVGIGLDDLGFAGRSRRCTSAPRPP